MLMIMLPRLVLLYNQHSSHQLSLKWPKVPLFRCCLMYARLQRLRAYTYQTASSYLTVKHISFGGCPGLLHTPLLALA